MRNSRIPTPNKRLTRRQAAKQQKELEAALAAKEDTTDQGHGDAAVVNAKQVIDASNETSGEIQQQPQQEQVEVLQEHVEVPREHVGVLQEPQTSMMKKLGRCVFITMCALFRLCLGSLIFVYMLSLSRQHMGPLLRSHHLPGWMFDFETAEHFSIPDPVEILNTLAASLVTVFIMSKL